MTRYTVVWSTEATDQLTSIWLDAADRPSVTAAANAIDGQLTNDPQSKGTDLSEGLRVLEVPPLHVLFAVTEPDRSVKVVLVRRSGSIGPVQSDGNGEVMN
jgi:hypothetical protein